MKRALLFVVAIVLCLSFLHAQTLPSGIALWLRADSARVSGGVVDTLRDLSGNNRFAVATGTQKPQRILNALNGQAVMRFDGSDDRLTGAQIPGLNDSSLTIFSVASGNSMSNSERGIFSVGTATNGFWFERGTAQPSLVVWNNNNFLRLNGSLPNAGFRYRILSARKNRSQPLTALFSNTQLLASSNNAGLNGSFTNNSYVIGRTLDTWTGDIAEVIVYNRALSDSEMTLVNRYLRVRYAPALNLGTDIAKTDFCSVPLLLDTNFFSNIQWSTGSTAAGITVTQTGTYWVSAKDLFGFDVSDTINITYPSRGLSIKDTTVCLGNPLTISTLATGGPYTYQWSNGATTASVNAIQTGTYRATITANGCAAVTDSVKVFIDSLSVKATLGNDTNLCTGNILSLLYSNLNSVNNNIAAYNWSTGSVDSFVLITTTGNYALTAQNTNGCQVTDTIFITVIGVAPNVNFAFDTVCFGDSTTLTNLAGVPLPDVISSIDWFFPDSSLSSDFNLKKVLPVSGNNTVRFTATTNTGCAKSITKIVRTNPLPVANFVVDDGCVNVPIDVTDSTSIPSPDFILLKKWDWGNGNITNGSNPVFAYTLPGAYLVQLELTSALGCKAIASDSITITNQQPAPEGFELISPVRGTSIAQTTVQLNWQVSTNAQKYNIQVATDRSFQNTIIKTSVLNTTFITSLPAQSVYYWRVTAVNACKDSFATPVDSFSILIIRNLGGLTLWLRGDSTSISTPNLTNTWFDISGNNNHAASSGTLRPERIVNAINGHPTLRFDGNDDRLTGGVIPGLSDSSITVFSVASGNSMSASERGIFSVNTSTNGFWFERGTSQPSLVIWNNNAFVRLNNSLPNAGFNYSILGGRKNRTQPLTSLFINTQNIVSSSDAVLNGPFTNTNYVVGRTVTSWTGNIAEVIVFNRALSDAEMNLVNLYLRTRYAPPVNLGPDIKFTYGACDTTLRIRNEYSNVLWSTGDTGVFSIKVRKSGKYWVRATDVFGFVSSDTVNVFVPYSGISPTKDTIVCAGNNVELKYNINGSPYAFNWSTGDTGVSAITVNQSGSYFVRVSDTIGCTLTSDTIRVSIDSLEFFSVLNEDTTSCTNAPLGLFPYLYPYKTYLWSTGSNKDTILIPGPGKVFVTVTDVNGCSTKDSIDIKIKGVAPVVDFGFKNICLGDTTEFTDSTKISPLFGESIAKWSWTFSNYDTSTQQNPRVAFPNPILYPITLYVETDSGCNATKTKNLQMGARPSPFISYNVNCANTPVVLTDASTIPSGDTIKFWNWDLGSGNTFTTRNVTFEFPAVGQYSVKLVVTSAKGCVDSALATVEVFPPINPDFTYTNQCVGQTTLFQDVTPTFSIIKRIWRLSDQTGVINDSLSFRKVFATADTFTVSMEVRNAIGCVDTVTKEVVIYPIPVAVIDDTIACIGESVVLTEKTQSLDSIVRYDWIFGGNVSKQRNPVYTVNDTGSIFTQLKVTSLQGCIDSAQVNFRVIALPKADFTYSPPFGESPLNVIFSNVSTNAATYEWNFGDGTTSTDKNPTHVYQSNDTFDIRLKAINQLGCADSTSRNIIVIPTDADIQLATINTQNKTLANGATSTQIIARFVNIGTQPIINAQFLARLDDGTTILDEWTGLLYPGETLLHTFSSSFYLTSTSVAQYVCVEAINVNNGNEKRLDNNKNCRSLNNKIIVTNLYPNPTSGDIFLDIVLPDEVAFDFEVSNEMGQRMVPLFSYKGVRGINTILFDTRSYRAGIYYLRIKYNENTEVKKFVVR